VDSVGAAEREDHHAEYGRSGDELDSRIDCPAQHTLAERHRHGDGEKCAEQNGESLHDPKLYRRWPVSLGNTLDMHYT
jgi:hypothetical protein